MTLNEYQMKAMTTCLPTSNNFSYMFFNLVGEVGELASKIGKHIRKDKMVIRGNCLDIKVNDNGNLKLTEAEVEELEKEVGDILWQLSGVCSVMGWSLENIAQQNLEKLASRKERGVVDGNGDNR